MLDFLRGLFRGNKKVTTPPEPVLQADEEWYTDPATGKRKIRKKLPIVPPPVAEEEGTMAMEVADSLVNVSSETVGCMIMIRNNEETASQPSPNENVLPVGWSADQPPTPPENHDADKTLPVNGADTDVHGAGAPTGGADLHQPNHDTNNDAGGGGGWGGGTSSSAPDSTPNVADTWGGNNDSGGIVPGGWDNPSSDFSSSGDSGGGGGGDW